uniref:Uncharacterized protein n=1 Tax=Romanomermis culicivorax TaxID=13658 RepID=A0A915I5K6_ROMCU
MRCVPDKGGGGAKIADFRTGVGATVAATYGTVGGTGAKASYSNFMLRQSESVKLDKLSTSIFPNKGQKITNLGCQVLRSEFSIFKSSRIIVYGTKQSLKLEFIVATTITNVSSGSRNSVIGTIINNTHALRLAAPFNFFGSLTATVTAGDEIPFTGMTVTEGIICTLGRGELR